MKKKVNQVVIDFDSTLLNGFLDNAIQELQNIYDKAIEEGFESIEIIISPYNKTPIEISIRGDRLEIGKRSG